MIKENDKVMFSNNDKNDKTSSATVIDFVDGDIIGIRSSIHKFNIKEVSIRLLTESEIKRYFN